MNLLHKLHRQIRLLDGSELEIIYVAPNSMAFEPPARVLAETAMSAMVASEVRMQEVEIAGILGVRFWHRGIE